MKLPKKQKLILLIFLTFLVIITPNLAQSQELIQQARNLYQTGQYSQVVPLLQQAAQEYQKKGDTLNQAIALTNLAATFSQLQQWQQAEQTINNSLSLLKQQQTTPETLKILAQTKDMQGQIQLDKGKIEDAFDSWQEAAKIYQQIDAKEQAKQSLINTSQAVEFLGLYPRSCNILLSVLEIEAESCELSQTALKTLANKPLSVANIRGMNALGNVLRVLGQLPESQQVLEIALQGNQQLNSPQDTAEIYLNLGNTARTFANQTALETPQRTQYEKTAITAYQQAAKQAKNSITQIQAKLNQLSLLTDRQNWQEAADLWRDIQGNLNNIPSNRTGIYAQINLGQTLIKLAESPLANPSFSEIDKLLKNAYQQAIVLGDVRLQAYILGSQGRLYELQAKNDQAETITTQALALAPAFKYPDIAYQLLWQLGRNRQAQGDTKGAIKNYSQAVDILGSLRGDLVAVNPEVQFSFRESVEPIYRELVALLLQEEPRSQNNLKQARQTIESLQLAELDNFFQDACADAKTQLIDEVDRSAAVIYPIILSDRLEVILSIPGQPLRNYSIGKNRSELETTFKQARIALRRTAFAQERLPVAQQIYDWLIRPAEKDLAANNIKTLVFVLDGYLRNLPMAMLHDGQNYLVQKYNIALTPGLQLLESRPLKQVELKVLTAGLTEARLGFPPLPGVAKEVREISAELPSTTLLNQQFVSREFENKVQAISSPIIHLATHGQFSSNAADTFILTWDQRINVKEFDQVLRSRTGEKQLPIELLVLSACETAAGDDRAALGLAGMAIRSGARSTLATLWQVNDESTAIFMTEFYRQISQPGISKAEALRKAQLTLLQNPKYQNPYFWAPFVLVGNWQ